VPLLESIIEVLCNDMPRNACEGYRTLPPGLEAKVELVVFDPLNTADTFLSGVSLAFDRRSKLGRRYHLPCLTLPDTLKAFAVAFGYPYANKAQLHTF
jgi:hypothetical protein